MRYSIYAAVVLLIVQVGLVFYTHSTSNSYDAYSPDSTLFSFSPESVSSVTIVDGKKQEIQLEKAKGVWQIAGEQPLAVAANQLKQLLETLSTMKKSLAVATSKEAAKRFKVDKESFEHHIRVQQGESEVVDLYVGTSPGFRQSHARVAGQDNILSLPLSAADLTPTVENWIDKEMLQLKEENLQRIDMADFSLEKKEGKWQLSESAEGEQNSEEIKKLVDKLTGLTIETVLEATKEKESKEPDLHYTLTIKDKAAVTYDFTKSDDGYYMLKVSGEKSVYKIQEWVVTDILENAKKEKLLISMPVEK